MSRFNGEQPPPKIDWGTVLYLTHKQQRRADGVTATYRISSRVHTLPIHEADPRAVEVYTQKDGPYLTLESGHKYLVYQKGNIRPATKTFPRENPLSLTLFQSVVGWAKGFILANPDLLLPEKDGSLIRILFTGLAGETFPQGPDAIKEAAVQARIIRANR